MFHAFFHHMSTSWAFYPNDCGWPSMGQGSALGGAVRTLGVSWRPGLRGWPGFFPELSERMGVPPVIIHFRLGFSINHQFISIYWVPPWLWKPLSWWKEWRWTIGGLRIKKTKRNYMDLNDVLGQHMAVYVFHFVRIFIAEVLVDGHWKSVPKTRRYLRIFCFGACLWFSTRLC